MRRLLMVLCMVLLSLSGTTVQAQGGTNDAIQKAVAYTRAQQGPDGVFAGFGATASADAVIALVDTGLKATDIKNGQASAIDGLAKQAPDAATKVGVAAKFILASLVAGQSPRSLGGVDLIKAVENGYKPDLARYGDDVTSDALALLALRVAGDTVRPETIVALEKLQLPDGGWSFDGNAATGSDTNTTAIVFQSLVSIGGTGEAKSKALAYLRAQQNGDGGFPYSQTSQFGNASDTNSTALGIQAILASGEPMANWVKNGKSPVERLLAFQNPSGAFRFQDAQADDNQFATYQALPALAGKTYPLDPILITQPAPENTPALTPAPITGTLPLTGTPTITPTLTPGTPVRLPDTGGSTLPLTIALSGAVLLLTAGLFLRRRSG